MTERIALVSGGNRGIGLEICRQLAAAGLQVVMGSRSLAKGQQAAEALLQATGLKVEVLSLDVSEPESIRQALATITENQGRLDVLVNNAGIMIDKSQAQPSVLDVTPATIHQTLETNVYGPLLLIQGAMTLMQKGNYGRMVNVSSGMGQLSEMGGQFAAYRLSKVMLNALTRIVHAERPSEQIKINTMCPGWVRTEMGGPQASRDVAQGADTAVWLATLPADGPSGQFFRDRQPLPW